MEIKPGRYTLRNKLRAFIATKHDGCWLGGWIRDEPWMYPCGMSWNDAGENVGKNKDYDLVSPGWPLELRDGGWYRDSAGDEFMLQRMPIWYQGQTWRVLYRMDYWSFNGSSPSLPNCRLIVEQLPEPPDWARDTKE